MIGLIPCRAVNASISPVSPHRPSLTADNRLLAEDQAECSDHERLAGLLMRHSLPWGRSAATYSSHGRSPDTVQKMKSNERAALRNSSVPRVAMKCVAPSSRACSSLSRDELTAVTSHPHLARHRPAKCPRPPTPTTATRSVGPHTVLQDRREHCGARAHQRSGVLGFDLVRQRKGELPVADPNVGGEPTTVTADDGHFHCRAEVLETGLAPLAPHARSTYGPDPDPLTDAEPIDLGPDGRDNADHLVSGHQRVLRESEVVVDHGDVGVADSAMGYLDVDLVKADLPWVVLEQFQPTLGGPGGVSADHHGGRPAGRPRCVLSNSLALSLRSRVSASSRIPWPRGPGMTANK